MGKLINKQLDMMAGNRNKLAGKIDKVYGTSKQCPLLKMEATMLVQIYSQKLTLLTKKQRVIFDLLSNGMLIKDIAKNLEFAEITIKVAKSRIMLILGVASLQEMAVISKCTSCKHLP